jgi:hypothetical protein
MSELAVQIANTEAFIAADPVTLTIQRDTLVDDGAGGKKKSGSPTNVTIKTVRLIPQSQRGGPTTTQTTNGELERQDYVLLGHPDLVGLLQRDDFFVWKVDTWDITAINKSPAYEFKADVKIRKDA